jgi:holo-[acyl-carrier protein] synthase
MILGIGVDIIELLAFRRALERNGQRFLERLFTRHEVEMCAQRRDPVPGLCARFAAKEALAKALGLGIFRAGLHNMEVRNRDNGEPYFAIHGTLRAHLRELGGPRIHLSISHGQGSAVATVIVEAVEPE